MIDVVVDTNVLVASFRSSLGTSYRLLQTIEQRRWRPVISPALAFEYESVLKRGTEELGLSLGDVDDFMEYLCSRARLVQIYFHWRADRARLKPSHLDEPSAELRYPGSVRPVREAG